jgi:ribosome-associated heat shock protein Hsp15
VSEPVRVDVWLWAARFFKTRTQANEAVGGGHVEVNGVRAKPSRTVGPGDELQVTIGQTRIELVVRGTGKRRGSAAAARELYEETEASAARREAQRLLRKLEPTPPVPGGRPTKRDRRRFEAEREQRRRAVEGDG